MELISTLLFLILGWPGMWIELFSDET